MNDKYVLVSRRVQEKKLITIIKLSLHHEFNQLVSTFLKKYVLMYLIRVCIDASLALKWRLS